MKKILLVTLLPILLVACKNETAPDPITPHTVDAGPKTERQLIDSIIVTQGNSVIFRDYNYDSNNRITDMHEKSAPLYDYPTTDHIYTYDSQGNLARSAITRTNDKSAFDYTYKDGTPTFVRYTDFSGAANNDELDIATANNFVTEHTYHTPSGESSVTTFTYTGGNKQIEDITSYSPGGIKSYGMNFTDEYGTKKSPFLYTGSKWMLPDVPFANQNDLIKETASNNGLGTISIYANTYNKQGYPISVDEARTSGGKTIHIFTTYKYIDAK